MIDSVFYVLDDILYGATKRNKISAGVVFKILRWDYRRDEGTIAFLNFDGTPTKRPNRIITSYHIQKCCERVPYQDDQWKIVAQKYFSEGDQSWRRLLTEERV